MPIVMQAAFTIKVLPLKAQGVVDLGFFGESSNLPVGFVLSLPDDVSCGVGDFLWDA